MFFLLRKNIMNYRNINLISFFNNSIICFIINIYSNDQQNALKYLKDIEINLSNVHIMTGYFNIKDNDWNCHMLSPFIPKICLYDSVVIIISLRQACLPWQLFFLQYIPMVVIQQLRYPVFHSKVLLFNPCQCFTTEISAQYCILKTLSIS